jgi:hypothetical protein
LPTPVVIGNGGRVPPTEIIEDQDCGDVELGGCAFDPATDGLDFYESLEAMRVQVNNAVAVGPTNSFGEIAVLGDDGANASVRTTRGGIIIRPLPGVYGDFNPERIILDDAIMGVPTVNVGDHFSAPVVGVMDYNFGNFKLLITQALSGVSSGLAREVAATPAANQLAVGNFNVENLDPTDTPAKFEELASLIVNNMRSPDLLSIEEVQDNNGPVNDSEVNANVTWSMLISAISAQGGPTYQYRQINPVDDQDGGEPGGNIRQGFLFRTDRGLAFVDRPGGCSTCDTQVVNGSGGPELSFSPGRIRPTATAFNDSRKPLAGEFTYNGRKIFVVGNHLNSKGGDEPLFGRFQQPERVSEVQRHQQAHIINDFVDQIVGLDPSANVIVLGDLNDFYFSTTVNILEGDAAVATPTTTAGQRPLGGAHVLNNLMETLPLPERYSYVFDGNSQDLDNTLVSNNLLANAAPQLDVVHVNSEFAAQASDHDPQVTLFTLPAGSTATTTATRTATVTATATATCVPGGVTTMLLIPDSTNDRVMSFDAQTGNLINANFIPSDSVHLATPKNAILSPSGNTVLVADQIRDVVQEYSLSGAYIRVFAPASGPNPAILDNIRGITLRPNGNLLVTVGGGANSNAVAQFDPSGNYIGNFVAAGAGGLVSPFDVYYRSTLGDYLVTGFTSDAIHRYDSNGNYLGNLNTDPINVPEQLDEAANLNVLAASFNPDATDGVYEYLPAGTFVGRYDPPSMTQYNGVYELPNGNLLVTTNTGVHEITRGGVLVNTKYSGAGAQYIEFVQIQSIGTCPTSTAGPATTTSTTTATRTASATGTATRTGTATVTTTPCFGEPSSWRNEPPMTTARAFLAAATVGLNLYTISGFTNNVDPTVERFDPDTNTWTTMAPIPTPISQARAAGLGTHIYVPGGFNIGLGGATNGMQIYDQLTNTWSQGAPLPEGRYGSGVVGFGGKVYIIAGNGPSFSGTDTVFEYDPATNTYATKAPVPPAQG